MKMLEAFSLIFLTFSICNSEVNSRDPLERLDLPWKRVSLKNVRGIDTADLGRNIDIPGAADEQMNYTSTSFKLRHQGNSSSDTQSNGFIIEKHKNIHTNDNNLINTHSHIPSNRKSEKHIIKAGNFNIDGKYITHYQPSRIKHLQRALPHLHYHHLYHSKKKRKLSKRFSEKKWMHSFQHSNFNLNQYSESYGTDHSLVDFDTSHPSVYQTSRYSNYNNHQDSRMTNLQSLSLKWITEPPRNLLFSNSTGGRIDCQVAGLEPSSTSVKWILKDGQPLIEVPGLIEVGVNNSLVFAPFPAHLFDPKRHDATYQCMIDTSFGVLKSRPVAVRAVVPTPYEIQVYNQHVIAGNVAVLRCDVPTHVKDYVSVTSWLRDGRFSIFPSLRGDGKYHVSETGVLHVMSVTAADSMITFRCRTLNSLSSVTDLSSEARIIVTDSRDESSPRSMGLQNHKMETQVGSSVTLPCDAQGYPPPTKTWYRYSTPIIVDGSNSWLIGGALVLSSIQAQDAGEYRCQVNNTVGMATLTTRLIVTSPIAVQISPSSAQITAGRSLQLRCMISGGPVESIDWYKDGVLIRPTGHIVMRKSLGSADESVGGLISAAKSSIKIDRCQAADAGIYQCRAESAYDVSQDHSIVTLGASAPQLTYRFIAHTLQPGPSVSLKCIARGTPTPHLSWSLDGFGLPQSHRFLMGQYVSSHGDVISHVNITSVRVTDGGLYQCTARNDAGTAQHSERLNIYGKPTVRQMGQLTAVAGETFAVTCPVGGYPIDKISWLKEGVLLPLDHRHRVHPNGTLTISSVSRLTDEGAYTCQAIDRQGNSDSEPFTMQVRVAPSLSPIQFEKGLQVGDRVMVTCVVTRGDSPIQIFWLKDMVPVNPMSHSHLSVSQTNEFSSSLILDPITKEHSGNYRCVARNQWAMRWQSSSLDVNVPPKLAPIVFTGGTRAGQRVQAICSIEDGDPPIILRWYKDGVHLLENVKDYQISQANEFTTILVIKNTVENHSGNYTCSATNAARATSVSTQLSISVPPTWLTPPEDGSISLGGSARLHCSANGFPQPSVTWRKLSASGDWADINRPGISFIGGIGNSSLVISRATQDHEGKYMCKATNGVGTGLSKIVKFTVHEPPWFPEHTRRVEVEVGATTSLTCRARGDPPLTLRWLRDDLALPADSRFKTRDLESPVGSKILELVVQNTQPKDSGTYSCEATNLHGSRSNEFHIDVLDVPLAPTDLMVVAEGSRYVVLKWSAPPPNPSSSTSDLTSLDAVTSYRVSYIAQSGYRGDTVADSTTARVEGLVPATKYVFSVIAENRVGQSETSNSVTKLTLEEKPSGHPKKFKVVATTSKSFRLSWMPPHENETNGIVKGYHIGYRDNSFSRRNDVMAYSFISIPMEDNSPLSPHPSTLMPSIKEVSSVGGVVEATLVGLTPFTRYALVVQAYNARGVGPASSPVTVSTLEDKPSSPPSHVTCKAVTSSNLVITWSPPETGANGVITSYRVSYRRQSGGDSFKSRHTASPSLAVGELNRGLSIGGSTEISFGLSGPLENGYGGVMVVTDGLTAKLSSLKAFTNYSVTVSAATAIGVGTPSDMITCATQEDVPSAPSPVKAIPVGNRQVIVSWGAPEEPEGRITRYSVQWSLAGSKNDGNSKQTKTVDAEADHLLLSDLPSSTIEVWIFASTRVGRGEDSQSVRVTPTNTVSAGVWSIGGRVAVAWKQDVTLPCAAVGEPPPNRRWMHGGKDVKIDSRISIVGEGDLRILDAQKSSGGTYRCTVTNEHGEDSVTYQLAVLMPPSPPSLHVTETTSSSVRLQWSTTDDGGNRVNSVTLYYRAGGGETKELQVVDDGHTVSNLVCGSQYHFFVTAHNSIGSSESSKVVEASTKGRAPEPPPLFQFVTSNSTQATLYLSQWDDGGCSITHFKVEYKMYQDTEWILVADRVPLLRTYSLTGLNPGTKYDLKVTAYNSAGATSGLYSVITPHLSKDGTYGNGWVGTTYADVRVTSIWSDRKVLVPLILSPLAVILCCLAVCICIRRSKEGRSSNNLSTTSRLTEHNTVISRTCDSPTKEKLAMDTDKNLSEDHNIDRVLQERHRLQGDDIYHYATSTYQFGHLSPPPPAPHSPASQTGTLPHNGAMVGGYLNHTTNGPRQQQGFLEFVYHQPSMNEVDEPNLNRTSSFDVISSHPKRNSVNFSLKGDVEQTHEMSSVGKNSLSRDQRTLPRYHHSYAKNPGSKFTNVQKLHQHQQGIYFPRERNDESA